MLCIELIIYISEIRNNITKDLVIKKGKNI